MDKQGQEITATIDDEEPETVEITLPKTLLPFIDFCQVGGDETALAFVFECALHFSMPDKVRPESPAGREKEALLVLGAFDPSLAWEVHRWMVTGRHPGEQEQ